MKFDCKGDTAFRVNFEAVICSEKKGKLRIDKEFRKEIRKR